MLDLASQQLSLAPHQFFLAHPAVDLFCWRARNSDDEKLKEDLAEETSMVHAEGHASDDAA